MNWRKNLSGTGKKRKRKMASDVRKKKEARANSRGRVLLKTTKRLSGGGLEVEGGGLAWGGGGEVKL